MSKRQDKASKKPGKGVATRGEDLVLDAVCALMKLGESPVVLQDIDRVMHFMVDQGHDKPLALLCRVFLSAMDEHRGRTIEELKDQSSEA